MAINPNAYWGGSLWNLRPQGYDLNNDGKIDDATNSPELFTNFLQDRFNSLDTAGQGKFGGQFQGVLNALNPGQFTYTVPGQSGNALYSSSSFQPWMQEKLDSGEWMSSMGPEISVDDAIATLGIQDPYGGMRMPTAEDLAAQQAAQARQRDQARRAAMRTVNEQLGPDFDWANANMRELSEQFKDQGIKGIGSGLARAKRSAIMNASRMAQPGYAEEQAAREAMKAQTRAISEARRASGNPAAPVRPASPVSVTPGAESPAMQTKPAFNKNLLPGQVTTPGFVSGQNPPNLGTKPAMNKRPSMNPRRAALQQRMGGMNG